MRMDFAPRRSFRAASLLLLALGIGGSVHALWQRHHLLQHRATVAMAIEAGTRARTASEPKAAAAPSPAATREMEEMVAGLRHPWEAALDALQRASRPDVVVSRMEPEARGARLRILGRADSSVAFLDFTQRLRDDALWRRVDPLSEAVQEESASPARPIAFQLSLEWAPP